MVKQGRVIIFILLLLFMVIMVFFCLPFFASPIFTPAIKAYTTDDIMDYYEQNDTIVVEDMEDWVIIAELLQLCNFLDKTLILNCDVDMQMHPYTYTLFNGTFDGNNHSIYNLTKPLFSIVYEEGQLKNMHFYNANLIDSEGVIITNYGIIDNLSANGYIQNNMASGLVYENYGIIKNSISYLTIKDTSPESLVGIIAGIVCVNWGEVVDCHYAGKQILSPFILAGGISAQNFDTISKCSSHIDFEIHLEDATIERMKIGGIVGINGYYDNEVSHKGIVENCHAILNVKYISETPIDFDEKSLIVCGIIASSQYTQMSYCYSDMNGEGDFFGIVFETYALVITQEIGGQQVVVGYDFIGTKDITHCFSTALLLIPYKKWGEGDNLFVELLDDTNEQISTDKLLNIQEESLIELLTEDNQNANWQGHSQTFPRCSQLFVGDGTAQQPFLINSKEDIYKLQFFFYNQPLSFYFEQSAELDFSYVEKVPFDLSMSFVGHYDGNDFAIYNYNCPALFATSIGTIKNLGFVDCHQDNTIVIENNGTIINCYTDNILFEQTKYNNPNIYNNNTYIKAQTFGYTGTESFQQIPLSAFEIGDGSYQNPYVIYSASQLSNLGAVEVGQYVVLGNDISINSSSQSTKWNLNNGGFNGHFDGRGHSIVGLINEPLVSALTGTITNLKIRGIRSIHGNAGLLVNTIEELGRVEKITIYGSLSGAQSGGVAGSNAGLIASCINYSLVYGSGSAGICGLNDNDIELCTNFGQTSYGIANNSLNGTIKDCIDEGSSIAIYNEIGLIKSSLEKKLDAFLMWNDNQFIEFNQEDLAIDNLREYADFDLKKWGYKIGVDSPPEVKRAGVFYKHDIAYRFFVYDIHHNRIYNRHSYYAYQQIEDEIVQSNQAFIEYQWYYNDEIIDMQQMPNIKDAGVYQVFARYIGNDYINSYVHSYKITIAKATLPTAISLDTDILGVFVPYIYDGEVYDISRIKASGLEEYGVSASDYTYTIKLGSQPVENIIEAGQYSVNIKVNNNNYREKIFNAVVTVNKANLDIYMSSYEVDYLSPLPEYEYYFELQTNTNATLEEQERAFENAEFAILQAEGNPICNYQLGGNIGEYDISFSVALNSYNVIVHEGILAVKAINLTSQDIVFEDVNITYNGDIISHYAQIYDNDISVDYVNNSNKDVGEYEITAIFSKPNYNSLELVVILKIGKARLQIKAQDKIIEYNQSPPQYSHEEIAFLGDDDITCLVGEIDYQCEYVKGDNVGEYDIIVSGYSAENYQIDYIDGALLVNRAFMTDVFTYENKVYVYDAQPKAYLIDLMGYDTTVTYYYYLDEIVIAPQTVVDVNEYRVDANVASISENYKDTVFSATLTIQKADLAVYLFEEYFLEYNGQFQNIEYEGSLPQGQSYDIEQIGLDNSSNSYDSFRNVGVYYVSISFAGNDNYNDLVLDTVLTVYPKSLEIAVENAVYNNRNIEPEYSYSDQFFGDDSVPLTWLYRLQGSNIDLATIKDAGHYTCFVVSQNANYTITNTPILVVDRYTVTFMPNYVEFVYGMYNVDFEYNARTFNCTKTYVTQKNYYIDGVGEYIDVKYFYNGQNGAGIYNVISVEELKNFSFEMPLNSSLEKILVLQRQLLYKWDVVAPYVWQEFEQSVVTQYSGLAHKPFRLSPLNLVAGDDIEIRLTNNDNRDVGTYYVGAEISSQMARKNYILDVERVSLTITKAPLTVKAENKEVIRGTEFVTFTYVATGLKNGQTLSGLGVTVGYSFEYTYNTPIGVYDIVIVAFVLHNYTISFEQGTLIVAPNPAPQLTLSNKTFRYDGSPKLLSLEQGLPEGASVDYINNWQTDVGEYVVEAKVSFSNHTVQWLQAELKIIKADPIIMIEDISIPYYSLAKLKNSDIIGVAKIGDNIILGTYEWVGDTTLKRRLNEYRVRFIPTDVRNVNVTEATAIVEGKVIDREIFVFNNDNVIVSENEIYIKEKTILSLKNMYPNLKLYVNNQEYQSFEFIKIGAFDIEIRYNDGVVFARRFEVIMQDEENLESVLPSHMEKFEIRGGIINDSDSVGLIVIDDDNAIVELNKEIKEEMELFLNGEKVPFILLDSSIRQANIQIKYRGILLYNKSFVVRVAPQAPPEEKPYSWTWIIILASVFGGAGVVIFILFVARKTAVNRRRGYNPYEAVEKKREKIRKKFK